MKVLVFGATGYIGGHVADRFFKDGHEVTAVVRSAAGGLSLSARGMKTVTAAVSDIEAIAPLLAETDAVVWMAQVMLEEESSVMDAWLEHLSGTGKLLLFTSGTSLLSQDTQGDWSENSYAEDDPFPPRRQIAPRLDIENRVRAGAARGVRAIVIRPPLIWGHGGSRIIADLYHSARKTGAVCYIGRGLNVYTNLHVDDLADLYSKALISGVAGALYHGGSGETCYRALAEAVASALGVPTRSVTVAAAVDIWDRFMGKIVYPSCSRTRSPRARGDLVWSPDPTRCDILEECRNPAYAAQGDRALPSWVSAA